MRDGLHIVGLLIAVKDVEKADGSIMKNLGRVIVLAGEETYKLDFWRTNTDQETGDITPTAVAKELGALEVGARVACVVAANASVWRDAVQMRWNLRAVESLAPASPRNVDAVLADA